MRKITFFILFIFLCLQTLFTFNNSIAGSAYPYPIEFKQPNGNTISIQLKGDEKVRWAETIDNYAILFNSKGSYEYAVLDVNQNMVPSGILAKNASERKNEEILFLSNIPKSLHYSDSQIQMMLSAWDIVNQTGPQNAFPTTGSRNLVCILIGYSDLAFTKTQADFNNLFNQINYTTGGATGSVKDYYLETSYNQFNLTITVAGPYTASNTMAYYGAPDGANKDIRPGELMAEAVTLANPDVNYANFDNDGDMIVDGVYVIYAGYNEGAGASTNAIWYHSSSFTPVFFDGKIISKYACSSELSGTFGTDITGIGGICHEFGHVLGALDFYDTNYGTNGQYEGTGHWDLMGLGNWNNDSKTPAHHNAYTKTVVFGWAPLTTLSPCSQITLTNSTENSNSFYKYNTATADEYFLIENKQQLKFDSYVPGHGMLIYHVDGSYISSHGNSYNTGSHQGMYPVCAVAAGNPPTTYGTIDSDGCPFPGTGNKTSFSDVTTPASISWASVNTENHVTGITENNVSKTVSFTYGAATDVNGTISSNTNWMLCCSPYTVTSSITINAGVTLTIDSGVVVKFDNGQSMTVLGTLNANNVTFTSSSGSPSPGIWGLIQTGNASSSGIVNLSNCQINYAQLFNVYKGTATLSNTDLLNFSQYGVVVETDGTLNMTNGNINTNSASAASSGYGINGYGSANLVNVIIQNFANGVFLNNDFNLTLNASSITNCSWPIVYSASADLILSGINTFSGNTNPAVYMGFTNFSDTLILPIMSIPYYFPGSMTINSGGRMEIGSTNILKFANGTILEVNGTLNAAANPGESIYFTSNKDDSWGGDSNNDGNGSSPSNGNWYGIHFSNSSVDANCILNRCKIRYAGYNNTGGIQIENSSPVISNCEVSYSYSGIYIQMGGAPYISSINLNNCTYPYLYSAEGNITLSGVNSYTGNTYDYALLNFTNVYTLLGLPKLSIPYVINQNIVVSGTAKCNIESGNIIKVYPNQSIDIYGKINANASFGENIYFTSMKDDNWGGDNNGDGLASIPASNDWYGIRFYNTSIDTACILTACKIRYAGYNNTGGLSFENCSPTIIDCEITYSFSGIYIQMGGAPFVSNVTLSNCTYPYLYSAEGNITLTGSQTYIGNTHNYALLNFNYVYNLLGLPTIIIPYVINQNIIINSDASCNIGKGNIIKVYDGQYIDVYGKFKAIGTNTSNIYFTSFRDDNWGGDNNEDGIATAPSSGNWYGIKFFNSSYDTECIMRNCRVRYAGAGNLGGINMWDASPTIDSCNVSNSYFGIYVANASSPVLTNNLIGSSQMTPIAMSFEADPEFTNNTFSFSDNAYDAIGLISGSLTTNATLKIRSVTSIPNVTYLILGDITVPLGIQLNINKGIVIKSYSYYHRIMINGTLNANGSVDSLITFTSSKDDNYGNPADCNKDGAITSPQVGDWGGIIFAENSGGILNYCRIKYATVNNYSFSNCSTSEWLNNAAVVLIDASPTISNCEFKDLVYGISCYRVSNPSIINNSMINIQYTPFCISGSSNPSFAGITFTNVGRRAIGLLGGYICQNGTIKKRNVAGYNGISYVLLSDMTINAGTYVNIEPGVVIKVNNYYTNIYVDGGFRTDGTTTQNVIFTSIQDDNEGNPLDVNGDGNATMPSAGNWGSINFRSTSDDAYCKLNFTNVKYAGSNGMGAVNFENAGASLKNTTIFNSSNYGIYCNGNSNPIIDTVSIQNCSLDPIAMSLTSNPVFSFITFNSNFSQAIKIIEGTLSSNATLISRNIAGINNIAYIVDQLVISSNAKLVIEPGVVIKFRGYYNYPNIEVYGSLIANGSLQHKIYFTSFKDDSKGGDSNNDGNLSSPAKSDWGNYYVNAGIKFINNNINADTVNHLKNCEISYAYNGIRVENSHVTFDSCVIQQCGSYGIVVVGSANPDIKNTDFYNISNTPVELSMFSNPIFTNCTALNIGNMALSVIPETYSQSATIPSRNFGGYTNITYLMEGVCTVNSGTTITIPSGLSFKSSEYVTGFNVNGRLNILGTSSNPVIFTNIKDDTYGNPSDMNQDGSASHPNNGYQGWGNNWLTFNDVSDDSSIIKNVIFRYANTGIYTLSASPVIDSVIFDNLYYGVDMNGVSAPEIDNCIFQNLQYYPLQISLVSYPSSSSNNLISGSTYKMIKVRDETLTQDVTLPKRSFGGLINIPYLFSNYTVGTGATLTINPGVVCKFYGGGINIYKGFIAEGGFAADSNIVFTDYRDDFYGGDANADSSASIPVMGSWNSITFNDQSLDPLCHLKHCFIKYANYGIYTTSASPQVSYSTITNNMYGVYATAASNPVFNYCDFNDNYYWSINNVDKSFVIDATNCWWGSNLGPIQTNSIGNGTSIQELITTAVNYQPFKTTGSGNPLMGDVSLNGNVQAYDASLVLQSAVSLISLNPTQLQVGDVSGALGVTAYDASLILQYVIGLIQSFPAEMTKSPLTAASSAQLTVGSASIGYNQDVTIPLQITNVSGMYSTDIRIKYDPVYLKLSNVSNLISGMNQLYSNDSINGILSIAMAGTNPLNSDQILAQLSFHTISQSSNPITTMLTVDKFLSNESDMISTAISGIVTITDNSTDIPTIATSGQVGAFLVYPNPSTTNAILTYELFADHKMVNIEVYNMIGQKVVSLVNEPKGAGKYSVSVSNQGNPLSYGTYLIRFTIDGLSQSQIFQVVR